MKESPYLPSSRSCFDGWDAGESRGGRRGHRRFASVGPLHLLARLAAEARGIQHRAPKWRYMAGKGECIPTGVGGYDLRHVPDSTVSACVVGRVQPGRPCFVYELRCVRAPCHSSRGASHFLGSAIWVRTPCRRSGKTAAVFHRTWTHRGHQHGDSGMHCGAVPRRCYSHDDNLMLGFWLALSNGCSDDYLSSRLDTHLDCKRDLTTSKTTLRRDPHAESKAHISRGCPCRMEVATVEGAQA